MYSERWALSISFQLISRYLASYATDSVSGDESGGDADDGEPKESPTGESENQDDDKLDDSKYMKTDDDIQTKYCGALPNLWENKSNADPSSVRQWPAETTSETTGRGAQGQRCTAISMSGTWLRKDLFIVGIFKVSRQNTSSWPAIINCKPSKALHTHPSRTYSFLINPRS